MLLVLRFTTGRSEDQANLSPTCDRPGTRLVAPGTVQRTCVLSCKPLSNASCLNPVYRSEAAPRTSYSAEGASGYLYETRDGCADMPGGSAHRTIATPTSGATTWFSGRRRREVLQHPGTWSYLPLAASARRAWAPCRYKPPLAFCSLNSIRTQHPTDVPAQVAYIQSPDGVS